MKSYKFLLIATVIGFSSCDYFYKQEDERQPVARVNEVYLYEEDMKHLFSENISEEDSIIRATNFINQWAAEQLFVAGAKRNLNEQKLQKFDKLAEQYQYELYSTAYFYIRNYGY